VGYRAIDMKLSVKCATKDYSHLEPRCGWLAFEAATLIVKEY
jgi:hypothetical protein